jgi:hypothetical protein
MNRREFIERATAFGAVLASGPLALAAERRPDFNVRLEVICEEYDGRVCWFHPGAGAIPGSPPTVVLTMQRWLTARSDVFLPIHSLSSADLGRTWSKPVEQTGLGRRTEPGGVTLGVCGFTPKWHAKTKRLLGTGHTVRYLNDKLIAVRARETAWSVYDPGAGTWTPWRELEMPKGDKFWNAGAGSTQRVDLENGDILLPIYFKGKAAPTAATTVVRCSFDGETLRYIEHGSEMTVPVPRGLGEPSLALFEGRFYLTMRNDLAAYVATGEDGLHFAPPQPWKWDDGTDLGSYNTQAHWVTNSSGLFLVYTRRNAGNDNVVRHRAPLFIARADTRRLVVLRETERELVPNKGAQLGNFAVVDVNEQETWVTTSEGMGQKEAAKYGANGRVYAARLVWDKPNSAWNHH